VWGREPDGAGFTPPVWNKPVFIEPKYNPPVWKQSLFKGGGEAVEYSPRIFNHELCQVSSIHGRVCIAAFRNLRVQCISLNGRELYSAILEKGARVRLDARAFSSGPFVLNMLDANSTYRHGALILP
jgi:hypothetical protein